MESASCRPCAAPCGAAINCAKGSASRRGERRLVEPDGWKTERERVRRQGHRYSPFVCLKAAEHLEALCHTEIIGAAFVLAIGCVGLRRMRHAFTIGHRLVVTDACLLLRKASANIHRNRPCRSHRREGHRDRDKYADQGSRMRHSSHLRSAIIPGKQAMSIHGSVTGQYTAVHASAAHRQSVSLRETISVTRSHKRSASPHISQALSDAAFAAAEGRLFGGPSLAAPRYASFNRHDARRTGPKKRCVEARDCSI